MINLRYHIVSITAVFLALGIGIAMGSSFLGAAALDRVDSNIQNARAEAAAARTQRDDLRREVGRDDQVASEMLSEGAPTMFTNDLSDVPVVVLTVGGIDGDSLDALQTGLTSSRAALDGTLRLNDSLVDEGSAAELADLVDSNATGGAALRADVVDAVAAELTDLAVTESDPADGLPPESTTEPPTTGEEPATTTDEPPSTTEPPAAPEPTTIRALVDAGFLEWEPAPGQEDAPGAGRRQVPLRGGHRAPARRGRRRLPPAPAGRHDCGRPRPRWSWPPPPPATTRRRGRPAGRSRSRPSGTTRTCATASPPSTTWRSSRAWPR